MITPSEAEAITRICANIEIDYEVRALGFARDDVPIPELVRQLKVKARPEIAAAIHKGATSQAIVDTATALVARDIQTKLRLRLNGLLARLEHLSSRF